MLRVAIAKWPFRHLSGEVWQTKGRAIAKRLTGKLVLVPSKDNRKYQFRSEGQAHIGWTSRGRVQIISGRCSAGLTEETSFRHSSRTLSQAIGTNQP